MGQTATKPSAIHQARLETLKLPLVKELDFEPPNCLRNNRKYKEVRSWEYLYEHEVEAMLKTAKTVGHPGHTDATLTVGIAISITGLSTLAWIVRDVGVKLFKRLAQFFGFWASYFFVFHQDRSVIEQIFD